MSDRPEPTTGTEPGFLVDGVTAVVATGAVGPLDPAGRLLHEGDLTAQVALAVSNLAAHLEVVGMGLADVIRLGVSTTQPDLLESRMGVLAEPFDAIACMPLIHVRPVTDLGVAGMAVAVDAVAAR
jgi:enamine deaminase RidA (YjgF/YER057c/UK114 family)